MQTNKVTTAARRITRHLNQTPRELRIHFDAQGVALHAQEAGLHYREGEQPSILEAAILALTGKRNARYRMTERVAQDYLDAAAQYPGNMMAISEQVQMVASDREHQELAQ